MTALKKCPRLLLVPSEFSTYRDASRRLMAMLREVSPYLEQLSIDEAFLDVTHRTGRDGAPALAEELKDRIRETLGFTVNVGISTNRLLAKTASDFTKPDRVHVLWPEDVPARLWPPSATSSAAAGPPRRSCAPSASRRSETPPIRRPAY